MATFQSKLYDTVLKTKNYVGCLAGELVQREKYGDDISCAETKMLLLIEYIQICEFYYCLNYDGNGAIATPDYDCLTADEIQLVVSNMNVLMK